MKDLNESTFTEVTNSNELVIVDFYANWCGPCRMLSPILEQIKSAPVYKLNTDEQLDVAMKFNISSLPTILFFKSGTVIGKMIGLQSLQAIEAKIAELQ